jgi:hypothetical protein
VIAVLVAKPDRVKNFTVRAAKKPLITSKCQPPGATATAAC